MVVARVHSHTFPTAGLIACGIGGGLAVLHAALGDFFGASALELMALRAAEAAIGVATIVAAFKGRNDKRAYVATALLSLVIAGVNGYQMYLMMRGIGPVLPALAAICGAIWIGVSALPDITLGQR